MRMKSQAELQFTVADIPDLLKKAVIKEVLEAARPKLYGLQLLRENRDLVGAKGNSLTYFERGTISFIDPVTEDTDLSTTTPQEVSLTPYEIVPTKLGAYMRISQDAIDAAMRDIVQDHLEEAGHAYALAIDKRIFKELLGEVSVDKETVNETPDGSRTVFSVDNKPILGDVKGYVDGSEVTISKVDYYKGYVQFATAPGAGTTVQVSYVYSTRTQYVDAKTKASFSYEDAIKARTEIISSRYSPNVLVAHPDEHADLLVDSRFISTAEYGGREPILQGEIGQFAGLNVLVTDQIRPGIVLYLERLTAGLVVWKRELYLKRKEAQERDAYEFFFYAKMAPKVTVDKAVALSVNHASNAASLTV